MSTLNHEARLFGLDLKPFARLCQEAWSDFLRWPLIRGLAPRVPVLLQDDAKWLLVPAPLAHGKQIDAAPEVLAKRFARVPVAVKVDEQWLLRWSLPNVKGADLRKMVELDVLARSPFPSADTLWTFEEPTGAQTTVNVVACSRMAVTQIATAFSERWPALMRGRQPEAWVESTQARGHLPLPGFNDQGRLQRQKRAGYAVVVLLFLLLTGAVAWAMTPSIRLYMELQQARLAWQDLSQRAAPTLAARQEHVALAERAARLDGIAEQAILPLNVLRKVTDALPDEAYLRGLQAVPGKVTINGETSGTTAALMSTLIKLAVCRGVRAPQAASKPLGAAREQFVIEFQLDAPAPDKPSDAATPAEGGAVMKQALLTPVRGLQLGIFLIVVALACGAGWYVWDKHRQMQTALTDLNAKFARLQGILDTHAQIGDAKDQLATAIAERLYPADMDVTRAGNDAQQRISAVLTAAQLTIIGIQVLPPDGDVPDIDQIPIQVQVEGVYPAVSDALQVLSAGEPGKPVVLTRSIQLQSVGAVRPNEPVKISAKLLFAVMRVKA